MAQRANHYDAAFEAYLRHVRTPHVVVDETRRALLNEASLKSMDFIVYSARRPNLLIDVKGRKFPSGGDSQQHKWENWATADDLESLLKWQQVFGADFRAMLVFAYHIVDPRWREEFSDRFEFRENEYAFFGVWADEYFIEMRTRSESWETVTLPSRDFRRLRAPIENFL
jgi:hypothetical protein